MVTYLLPLKKLKKLWRKALIATFMTAREIMRRLRREGWYEKDHKGSHKQFIHATKKGKITVPVHSGDLPIGTLYSIFKQAGWK